MGTMPPIHRLRAWWTELHADNQTRRARECYFGNSPYTPASENCTVIVPPGEGVMYGFEVFCSEEHAGRDQEDSWP